MQQNKTYQNESFSPKLSKPAAFQIIIWILPLFASKIPTKFVTLISFLQSDVSDGFKICCLNVPPLGKIILHQVIQCDLVYFPVACYLTLKRVTEPSKKNYS